jgi:murein DD-endopeptidase MepM/ murein hydrolase activator NlpD
MRNKLISLLISWLFLFALINPVFAQDNQTYPQYIVQSGDTLGLIALRFGTSVDELIRANNITNPNSIGAGSKLIIPSLQGVNGVLTTDTVQFGNNLRTLNLSNNLPADLLIKLNRITSPSEIYAGSTLIVPQKGNNTQIQPVSTLNNSDTLLEESITTQQNQWTIILSNNLNGSWDTVLGETIFAPSKEKISYNPISPLLQDIKITPFPLIQGKTIEVKVSTKEALSLEGTMIGQDIKFNENSENNYVALIGIPALQEIGLYPIEIRGKAGDKRHFEFSQQVLLASGNYPVEAVNGVDASTLDPVAIAQENEILSKVTETTPQKAWSEPFGYPIDDPCMGSRYGNRRTYNQGTYHYYHTGIDFTVCANNLNIYAVAPGIVRFAGLLPTKGNFILIDHGWGVYSGYAHQKEFEVNVGDQVKKGQIIGIIGNTGRSVGPHLHWEIWINGVPVDPLDWINKVFP